jgi:hypothetical protein
VAWAATGVPLKKDIIIKDGIDNYGLMLKEVDAQGKRNLL